jgi:hypothetical protein
MNSPYLHERRRILDPAKKVKFCQLVRESHSLEEAAEWVDVSIRTVQRERKRDEGDHEIPDPQSPAEQLSPKTHEATAGDMTATEATTTNAAPPPLTDPWIPDHPASQLSPKIAEATPSDTTASETPSDAATVEAPKRQKAAKKRTQAQRRRAA